MKARHRLPQKPLRINLNNRITKWLLPIIILVLIKVIYLFSLTTEQDNFTVSEIFSDDVSAKEENEKQDEKTDPMSQLSTDNQTKGWDVEADFEWNIELIQGIKTREAAIRLKEDEIKREEERLQTLKADLEDRIELLSQIEKRITVLIETKKAVEDEKMRKLAKVFESTPPEQAGPLMSKLDVDIAAQLILKMQGRKAGRIWGYVEPDRAVQISKELARLDPNIDMNKISGK